MGQRKPPAQVRNLTGTNKNVKNEENKALRLESSITGSGAFVFSLPDNLSKETQSEFKQLYDTLTSINILGKADKIIFIQAAKTFDMLLELESEYTECEEMPARMLLVDKIDKLRKTLYQLLSKYFVTPEDRFKAALAVAHGEKKKTAVTRIIDDD